MSLLVEEWRDTQDAQPCGYLVGLSLVFDESGDGPDATARGSAHPSPLGLAFAPTTGRSAGVSPWREGAPAGIVEPLDVRELEHVPLHRPAGGPSRRSRRSSGGCRGAAVDRASGQVATWLARRNTRRADGSRKRQSGRSARAHDLLICDAFDRVHQLSPVRDHRAVSAAVSLPTAYRARRVTVAGRARGWTHKVRLSGVPPCWALRQISR